MDEYQQKLRELAERELDERYERMQEWECLDEKLRNAQRGKELAEALDDHGAYRLFKSEESLLEENVDYLRDSLLLLASESGVEAYFDNPSIREMALADRDDSEAYLDLMRYVMKEYEQDIKYEGAAASA